MSIFGTILPKKKIQVVPSQSGNILLYEFMKANKSVGWVKFHKNGQDILNSRYKLNLDSPVALVSDLSQETLDIESLKTVVAHLIGRGFTVMVDLLHLDAQERLHAQNDFKSAGLKQVPLAGHNILTTTL